ncbi:MAG: hypothetical protein AAF633_27480, partial [Chloroflexota bacterium]
DGYRLVQRWNWFQPNPVAPDQIGGSSIVFTPEGVMTEVGVAYQNRILYQASQENLYVDLAIAEVLSSGDRPAGPAYSADVNIGAVIHNLGNVPTQTPTSVTFRDQWGNVIGSGEIPPGFQGCAMYTDHQLQTWFGLPPGKHPFSVEISSPEELDAYWGNNQANGYALIGVHNVFMPMMKTY